MDLEGRFWNIYATLYVLLEHLVPYRDLLTEVLAALNGLPQGAVVLDAGCGAGAFLAELSRIRPDLRLVGIDRSEVMLAQARERLPKRIVLYQGDVVAKLKSLEGASVNAVVSMNVYYALDDPDGFLHEVRRVASAGRFVLVNPHLPKQSLIWEAHLNALIKDADVAAVMQTVRYLPHYVAVAAINAVVARRGSKRRYHFLPLEELARRLTNAGFSISASHDEAYGGTCCFVSAVAP